MAKIDFKGPVTTGNNKPVKTFQEAQKLISVCEACGCDAAAGFITLPDLNTADGDLFLVFVHNGTLHLAADTAVNRAHFDECCRERAAGAPSTSCDALGAL